MFKRLCPRVEVYAGNEEAVELMTYLGGGGWLEQVGSTMLTQILRDHPDTGARIVRRISAAFASDEYREAMESMKPERKR